ncbi:hypothetical protein B0H13DRAFT_2324042 [Mycena leptocephala]|nr:hypothetical protein B0H13DRAFT_2324042 [Mycena leptocephala]
MLPQMPASEWAKNMKEVLNGHVTRTPIGSPGPDVLGGFPAHLEPDVEPSVEQVPQDTLLVTAQSYIPSLATVKVYLPQAVATYLHASVFQLSATHAHAPSFTSGIHPSTLWIQILPPPTAPLLCLQQDDTTTNAQHESYHTTSFAGDTCSTTVHMEHSSSAIAPPSPSSSSPPSLTTARPSATLGFLPLHPGVMCESQSLFLQ